MENNICVLIDFENLAAGVEKEGLGRFKLDAVLRRLKDKGRILVARSYGDWGRFAKYKQDLLRLGVQLMELTAYRGQEKNRADIALAVDAMELAYTRAYLDTFVVISGDSDFTPLIMRLKELNKRVIGMGTRRSTSALLKDTCDEFIFYESVIRQEEDVLEPHMPSRPNQDRPPLREQAWRDQPPSRELPSREPQRDSTDEDSESEEVKSLTKDEAFALLAETVRGLTRDAPGSVPASVVKASVLRKEPAFDESEYGFPSFTKMLEVAQNRGLIVLKRDERGGGARVEVPSDAMPQAPEPETDSAESNDLPGLDGEAARLRERLAFDGVDPLSRLYRHTVVYEFADHVNSRMAQKKRNTLMYTVGDIARRCRDTDPAVPARHVKSVLTALAICGELLHPDGKPVRSPTAPFQIRKDGEGLLDALSAFYLYRLGELGESLGNSRALSQLLYGDEEHQMVVEEMVAWIQHDLAEGRGTGTQDAREELREARPERGGDGRGEPREAGRGGDRGGDRGDRGGDRGDGRRSRRDRRRDGRRGPPDARDAGTGATPLEAEAAEMEAAWAAGEPVAAPEATPRDEAPAESAALEASQAAPVQVEPVQAEPAASELPPAADETTPSADAATEEAAAADEQPEKKRRPRRRPRRKTEGEEPTPAE